MLMAISIGIAQDKEEQPNLRHLVDEALANNPDYLSAQKRWRSAEYAVPQAGALPDPTLGFAFMNKPPVEDIFLFAISKRYPCE